MYNNCIILTTSHSECLHEIIKTMNVLCVIRVKIYLYSVHYVSIASMFCCYRLGGLHYILQPPVII